MKYMQVSDLLSTSTILNLKTQAVLLVFTPECRQALQMVCYWVGAYMLTRWWLVTCVHQGWSTGHLVVVHLRTFPKPRGSPALLPSNALLYQTWQMSKTFKLFGKILRRHMSVIKCQIVLWLYRSPCHSFEKTTENIVAPHQGVLLWSAIKILGCFPLEQWLWHFATLAGVSRGLFRWWQWPRRSFNW